MSQAFAEVNLKKISYRFDLGKKFFFYISWAGEDKKEAPLLS